MHGHAHKMRKGIPQEGNRVKKFALVVAAATTMFAAVPGSAGRWHAP
jgi:hypothetical protein